MRNRPVRWLSAISRKICVRYFVKTACASTMFTSSKKHVHLTSHICAARLPYSILVPPKHTTRQTFIGYSSRPRLLGFSMIAEKLNCSSEKINLDDVLFM